jgi:hypothetical protein
MSKFGRKQREAPEGFDYLEPTLTALDAELRESKLAHCDFSGYIQCHTLSVNA